MKVKGKRGFKSTGTHIPDHRGNECYTCGKNTRNKERISCKACRYKYHYGRRHGFMSFEEFVNDPFYD